MGICGTVQSRDRRVGNAPFPRVRAVCDVPFTTLPESSQRKKPLLESLNLGFLQCPEELMSCLTKIMTHWHFWIFSVSLLLILKSNFIIFITFFSSIRYVPQLGFFFLLIITAPIIYNSSATFFFNAFGSPYQFSTYSEMLNYLDYYFSLLSHSLYAVSFSNCCFHFRLERSQNQTPFFLNYSRNTTF